MPLVVEDGTGLPTAESYVSVADATAYHAAMGNVEWAAAAEPSKDAALRRATQYVDARYRFAGTRLTAAQALEWPRVCRPWPVKRLADAVCELALRGLAGSLYADQVDAGRITEETIGPMTTKYAAPANGGQIRFAVVDDLVAPLLVGAGAPGVTKMARA